MLPTPYHNPATKPPMKTYIRTLRVQGGSVVVSIPPAYANTLNLNPGDLVAINLTIGGVITVARLVSAQVTPHLPEQRT